MPDPVLDVRLLGPLALERGGVALALGGRRQREVLAYLVVHAGRVVPAERLVDEIWGEAAPSTGTGPLRTYVSQLRRLLGGGEGGGSGGTGGSGAAGEATPLVSRPPGYMLDVTGDQVDAVRFERRFAAARAAAASGDPERALAGLDEALALWRGPALGDLAAHPALQAEAERLDQLALAAKELRGDTLLATGQHGLAAAELGVLASENPLRERLWALLMKAQYWSGRQADALRSFQQAREHLVDELGIEPGPELRELEQAILRQDPALAWRPPPERPVEEREPATGPAAAPGAAAAAGGPAGAPTGALAAGPAGRDGGAGRDGRANAGGGGAVGVVRPGGPRFNVPRQLTSFVGRVAERAMVADALAESRLVTLCGSGGCGKTRLATVVAEDVADRFPEGVWFVDLSAVSEPGFVVRAWAAALGAETDQPGPLDHLCRAIGDDRALMVLDNCEHVVEAAAEAVEEVLSRCPLVRILATSREELQVGAELVRRVSALRVPDAGAIGQDRDAVAGSEAVQLFVERGRAALGGFEPTGETLDDVARICRQLDGIPLAIELAAALVGSLPVCEIATRLEDRFGLLDVGRRRAPQRQRTLRAALDWSFDLLAEPERALLVRLGVFVGDFTLTAAETVAGVGDPLAVVRDLRHLVAKSMVSCVSSREGADRYRLLQIVRQYARERLDADPDAAEVRRRHAHYYADFAAEAERHVHGAAACRWLGQVVSELPNLRAAVAWAFSSGDRETGLRLAGSLRWFFARMGLLDEAGRWLEEGLRQRDELPPDLRLQGLTAATFVAFMRGDFSRTRDLGEEGVVVARRLGDAHQLAMALIARGGAAVYEGDLARAEMCFEEGGRLCRQLGDRWGLAWMLTISATGSRRTGDRDRARREVEQALAIFRDLGDEHGQVLPLVNLALIDQEEGRLTQARVTAREAARLAVALLDRQLQHTALCILGRIEQALGNQRQARELLVRSIRDYPGAHNQHMVAVALEGLAALAAELGDHGAAVALLTFTATLRHRWQIWLSQHRTDELNLQLAAAERAIGPDRVKLEEERGRELDLDEARRLVELVTRPLADRRATIDLVADAGAGVAGGPGGGDVGAGVAPSGGPS